jgi:hypothetical protein
MAGALLTLLYRLTLHLELRDRASINMAAYVLENEQPFPDIMAANRKDIFAAWARYKPVAHFCGALLDLHISAIQAHDAEDERREFVADFLFDHTQELFELASVYQSFGLEFRLYRTKGQTPLHTNTLYQLPKADGQARGTTILPLNERLVATARRYRAHKRWVG